ncbi:MAG: hypothetical protein HETSPECPRED_007283 [Heterodermia speciosa]|uniref:Uncharacterized protein n=1 Tax=Heterodermia speciosa TaxID=116794 RepID=A0A8H3IUY8_9LECA|nr:MAG: hypothetical protein HETSPECPRED_007283 [Heterodermia speciosa]
MSCELSAQGRAFSTVLTAFIGSIINGITSGYLVAFITAWISWFATLRILIGAIWSLRQAFSSEYTPISTAPPAYESVALEERGAGAGPAVPEQTPSATAQIGSNWSMMDKRLNRKITVLGWMGWVYTAVYSPVVQILWLAANWTSASGALKIVRGLGISVTALGLTIDTKKRYAETLRGSTYLGRVACVAFKLTNAGSAFGMGAMCAALLIKGALDLNLKWFFFVIYCVFMVIWAAGSFAFIPVQDGGVKGAGIILDVLMGAFAGVILAAPAFFVMRNAEQPTLSMDGFGFSTPESGQASLNDYLSCESVAVWRKIAAVLP